MAGIAAPLSQEFNKYYTDVVNCEVTAPPYYNGRVPHTFFFKKRKAFSPLTAGPSAGVLDYTYDEILSGSDIYTYGKLGTTLKVVKNNSTVLWTGTINASQPVEYKFMKIPTAKGTIPTGGTGITTGGTTITIIEDTTATWTVNAFAGMQVLISGSWVGTGQTAYISSNTATQLTVVGLVVAPGTGIAFKIFSEYGSAVSWIGNDGIYVMHNESTIVKSLNFTNILDAIHTNGHIYAVNFSKTVIYSEEGYNNLVLNLQTPIIGSVIDFLNIIDFQNYVLLVGNNEINNIVKESFTISWVVTETLRIVNLTSSIGMFQQGAFTVYNQGLYMVTNKNQYQAINITPAAIDKYIVTTQNQGIYIQKFLDNIVPSDRVRLAITDNNLYIIHRTGTITNVFIFEIFYQGWHRWQTSINITGYKYHFLGDRLYTQTDTTLDTDGSTTHEFNQSLEMISGEESLFKVKRHWYSKVYLGQNSTKDISVEYTVNLGSEKYTIPKDLSTARYLTNITSLTGVGTLGTSILGLWLLADSASTITESIADVAYVEVPTWFLFEILIMKLNATWTNKFECGWMLQEYVDFNSAVTAYDNVV